jgi:hypothetical protein
MVEDTIPMVPVPSPGQPGRAAPGRAAHGRRGLLVGLVLAPAARAEAGARLLMLERHDCPWCRRWLREVGEQSWNLSNLGQRAPLRRVDVAAGLPPDLRFVTNWRFTPTFVLIQGEHEIGRMIGYQGDHFFWQQAEGLLARLP